MDMQVPPSQLPGDLSYVGLHHGQVSATLLGTDEPFPPAFLPCSSRQSPTGRAVKMGADRVCSEPRGSKGELGFPCC